MTDALYRLPDWVTEPGRKGATYGTRCAFYVGGTELVVPADLLVPVRREPVPSYVDGAAIGTRRVAELMEGIGDAP